MRNTVLLALFAMGSLCDVVVGLEVKGQTSPPFCIKHRATGMYAEPYSVNEYVTQVKLVDKENATQKWRFKATHKEEHTIGFLETGDRKRVEAVPVDWFDTPRAELSCNKRLRSVPYKGENQFMI